VTNAEYIRLAREQHQKDGEIEIDDDAGVSRGADPGAYVQAWVWVYDPEGIASEEEHVWFPSTTLRRRRRND
jgi:hypothetical protein